MRTWTRASTNTVKGESEGKETGEDMDEGEEKTLRREGA